MENYSKGKLLGKGSFGSAWLCTSKDGKNYVIKEVDTSRMPRAERDAAEQEAKLLMALKHPNIVRCKECFTSASKLCIVMDWCSKGDLYGILQKRKGQPLPEDTVLDWFVQICLGLKHVHDRKILHRDLKSQNIFVSAGGLLKLGDFGVSKVLNSTFALATTAVGTPYYLSPEICQNRKYNQKSDMWSLGCVLYELSTMRQAFEAPNMRALIQKIIKGAYNPLPPSRSPELRALITSLLVLDARKRPSINDVLAMPVVRQRIARFLNQTLQMHEFSHTVIHGKPEPGHLVVALPSGTAAAVVAADLKPQVEAADAQAAAGGRIRLSAPPAVGLQGKPALALKPAVPRLSGPAIRQQAVPQSAAAKNLRSPSREQLLAAGAPPKPPSRAVSPSPQAAAAAQQQQRSPLVSPKLSPRGPSPHEGGVGVKLPSPPGDRPPAVGGLKVPSPRGSKPALPVAAVGAAAGFKLPSPRGDKLGAAAAAAGVKLPSPRGDKAVGDGAAAVNAAAAACQRAQLAQQERQAMLKQAEARRAVEAEAARQAADEAYQQRQAAAAEAAAEVARMRAADAKAAEDAAAARLAAEQRKMEARQQEQQRQQLQAQAKQKAEAAAAAARAASEEQNARARADEAAQRRIAEETRARARAAAEAQRRQAAAEARERERELMHQQMQQQKQEFIQRQQAAAANKQRAQEDMQCGMHAPAAGNTPVAVVQPKQQRRKAWSPPRADDSSLEAAAMERESCSDRAETQPAQVAQPVGGRRAAAAAGDELSAEQRRQVWEEMRAAAQRNKQQLLATQSPGLAAFLGAEEPQQQQLQQPRQQQFVAQEPPDMLCKQQQLQRQQQQQKGDNPGDAYEHAAAADADSPEGCSPWELRRARLEYEQAARDAQLREFQRQYWLEVKAAAARNKQQVMGELGIGKQQQQPTVVTSSSAEQQQEQLGLEPSRQEQQQPQPGHAVAAAATATSSVAEDEQGEEEFAAMVADMQDLVLLSEQQQQQQQQQSQQGNASAAPSAGVSREVSEESFGGTEALVIAGRFVLDGQEVQLPVSSSDSLGLKVEALRMYLEEALGTTPFLKVYHRLESLAADDDEEQVSKEFFNLLGADKLHYMQLVHQLIIAEEKMHIEQMV